MIEPLPDEIDDALWDEACRRAAAIRQFLMRDSGQSTAADVADLASELELSQASAYCLLKRFRVDGTVMSLAETKRGRRTVGRSKSVFPTSTWAKLHSAGASRRL